MKKIAVFTLPLLAMTLLSSCKKDDEPMQDPGYTVNDPDQAAEVSVDRFSDDAGMLFQRSANSSLPGPNVPIDFDMAPFITQGLGPNGEMTEYYNFDVMPTTAAPIYVLFKDGETSPVPDQLNIINVIPGDNGYNDFWQVVKVTVPSDYVANTASSLADLNARGFQMETTDMLVNCPVVPKGSTAMKRMNGQSNALVRGWYRDEVVYYFSFFEKELKAPFGSNVPVSPIYVTFNVNPDPNDPNSGPPSGFVTEMGSMQTHNVLATLPSDASYSPLWSVNVYDNADFSMVMDLNSAMNANILATGVANVNCPVVSIQ